MPTKATGIKPLSRHGDLEAIRSISYARYHALVTSLRARAKQKFVLRPSQQRQCVRRITLSQLFTCC